MKLRSALGALGLLAISAMPATAQITPIDDIQAYTDAGVPASPLNGVSVTVRGTLTALKGTWNGGTHYIQDATGGINFFDTGAPAFLIGQEIEVSGTVSSFGGEVNLSTPLSYSVISTGAEPAPIEYTIAEFVDNDGSGTLNAADYEILGWLAAIEGTVVFRPGIDADPTLFWDQGTFGLADGLGDTATVFIDRTTGIETGAVNPGDQYRVIGPISVFNATLQVKPRFQIDLIENPGNPFPQISNAVPNPWTPEAGTPITISATVTDNDLLASVTLFYRDRGATTYNSTAMVNSFGDTWEAPVPGTTAAGIEYYIEAVDAAAQTTLLPGSAPVGFLEVAVGTTSIVEIQSTLQGSTDASAFVGQLVNIEGVITAAPGELQASGLSNYAVGELEGGKWSGIFVFEGSGANTFFRGDVIRISGYIDEFNGITEILPQSGASIDFVSFGAGLPPVPVVSTDALDVSEEWESVIVATPRVAVVDTVFGGAEWTVKDAASDSTLYVDPAPAVSITGVVGEEMYVTGLLDTRFGRNEIVPINDGYIVLANSVSAPAVGRTQTAKFEQIAPNPFNPRTEIEFSLAKAGPVELVIFDSRGRRVETLVAGELGAGEHVRTWNGVDQSGTPVASGVYYARLRYAGEAAQVEKLALTK